MVSKSLVRSRTDAPLLAAYVAAMHTRSIAAPINGSPTHVSALRWSGRQRIFLASDVLPPCDFVALLLAAELSWILYLLLGNIGTPVWPHQNSLSLVGALLAPFFLYDPQFAALASQRKTSRLLRSYVLRFAAFIAVCATIGAMTQMLDRAPPSWLALWVGFSILITVATRCIVAKTVRTLQRTGALSESIAIVGHGPAADALAARLRQSKLTNAIGHVEVIGVFSDETGNTHGLDMPAQSIERLLELSKYRTLDWIVIAASDAENDKLEAIVARLRGTSAQIAFAPPQAALQSSRTTLDFAGNGMPLILLADRPIKRWDALLKTAEDALLGWLLALLLLPVFAFIALLIRLDSPGPIIFKQRRHAFNNTEFDIYKFRTMRWRPEPGSDLQQTARDDARVTRIGSFLRRTSLDELPQIINVLRGEMSLVGPRPHAVNMRTENRLGWEITDRYAHRHRVKPGMTGWSQVNGARGATDTTAQLQKRIDLDLYYIDHWSLAMDVKILLMTVKTVLKQTNAY